MLPTNEFGRVKFLGRNQDRTSQNCAQYLPCDICVPASPPSTQGCGINETPEAFWSNPKCPKMGFAATLLSRKWPVSIAKGRRNQRAVASFSAVIFLRAWLGGRIVP